MNFLRFFKTVITALLDCLFCWLSWMGSIFVFTYLFKTDYSLIAVLNNYIWILIPACLLAFGLCGVYRSLWQHPGIGSIIRLGSAVFLSSFAIYVTLRVYMGFWSNPGLGMMAFYFLLTASLAVRMFPRITHTVKQYMLRISGRKLLNIPQSPIKTLLVGAGESASTFLLHGSQQGIRPRNILGILDSDPRKHGYSLHGVHILGDDSMIPELCRQLEIDELVIAVPSMKNEDLRRIVQLTPTNRCKVRILSGLSADMSERLRDLNIGDLLGRPETFLDTNAIGHWIKGKTILVTGGGGSIGSELCRQILQFDPSKIIIFDISENNAYNLKEELTVAFGAKGRYRVAIRIGSVQDETRLNAVFEEFKPSIVFHAAAYKHVPLMEQCPQLALSNNVLGTYYTALCAERHAVERFVMISTDKAVNPTNVMGASKRLAELLVLSLNGEKRTEFVCVRFGNVLDSNGSVVPLFRRQIEAGGPVTVTHPEIIRYFMTIPEAARLVLEAGAMAHGGEIFILDMGSPVKIADLAENLIRMAGLTPGVDIKIEFTGLRPGEKLYEELLLDEEGMGKTQNDKIFVARPECLTKEQQIFLVRHIENTLLKGDDVRTLLKRFVPEYSPVSGQETLKDEETQPSESRPLAASEKGRP